MTSWSRKASSRANGSSPRVSCGSNKARASRSETRTERRPADATAAADEAGVAAGAVDAAAMPPAAATPNEHLRDLHSKADRHQSVDGGDRAVRRHRLSQSSGQRSAGG